MLEPWRQFADPDQGPPGEAMRATLDRWEEAAPHLLQVLDSYAEGRDRSDAAARIAFHAIYLAAQKRERRAFPALCHLARDNDALEAAIGDGITQDFGSILAQCFDGDLARLRALALEPTADEYVRHAALDAITLLHLQGRLPMPGAEPLLRDLHAQLLAQAEVPDMVWVGWQQAVAVLGIEALRPAVEALFREGRIDASFMGFEDFESDLRQATEPGADRMALLERLGVHPVEDVPALFDEWHRMRQREEAERARLRARGLPARDPDAWVQQPAVNPYRGVGRNDPCPCGSGKKFKKCCMPA
ncbi:DUF1186 domain-containing protein [Paracraurococcus lichenis]|uniref:DUF1186 domain-containing protein n=1 Tax=Paracraurococcus lichenis TaxID=3064888 RepID=A0ABT9DZD7_9PROT|nr:DUF1186 domain-containing protein [Paracraurococcus sp. LOR1-02]MDO9709276.1 DUF1186 domain-containing protein [Paracraurococcus sp. LOR1-02]